MCDRCGTEMFDEATTRVLETFYEHVAHDRAQTYVIDFDDIHPESAPI